LLIILCIVIGWSCISSWRVGASRIH
jgi:hypothetical protein